MAERVGVWIDGTLYKVCAENDLFKDCVLFSFFIRLCCLRVRACVLAACSYISFQAWRSLRIDMRQCQSLCSMCGSIYLVV